jgi:hypothetical protein
LILRFAAKCEEQGIPAVVAALTDDRDTMAMLQWCREQGIETLDMSFDRSDRTNLNLPHDTHPSARGHETYARKLHAYLTREEAE